MAEQIKTRYGVLDSRLAAGVRHALEVAVFYPALAPLNEVYLRLKQVEQLLGAQELPVFPPSHRWRGRMVDLFGRNVVGTRRSPVSPRGGRPNAVTQTHIAFAASRRLSAEEYRIIHHLLTGAGTFVFAEARRLTEVVDRWHLVTAEDPLDDDLVRPLLRAGRVGTHLTGIAAAGTWPRLLQPEPEPVPVVAIPAQASPPRASARVHRYGLGWALVASFLVFVLGVMFVNGKASAPEAPPTAQALSGGLEKPDLKIAIMPTTDVGPLKLAMADGKFADAGFTFDPDDLVVVQSGQEAVDLLLAGKVDIAYATYTPFVIARSQGADVQLVTGASSAGKGSCMVVAMPGSTVRSIRDIAGARVAVTARNTTSDLLVMAALKDQGIDHRSIDWVEAPFPKMADMLARGEIDAAFLIEPFLSDARTEHGVVSVFDTATGPRLDLPTAGYGALGEFAREHPRTMREFHQVMAAATAEATAEPVRVQPVLQTLLPIDTETAASPTLLTFRSEVDEAGLQEVTDLMRDFGMIPNRINVPAMIADVPE